MLQIISEDFSLSEANKYEIEQRTEKIKKVCFKEPSIKVFVAKPSEGVFSVTFKVMEGRKIFVSSDEESDFHLALNKSKKRLLRQISDYHHKVQSRKKGA